MILWDYVFYNILACGPREYSDSLVVYKREWVSVGEKQGCKCAVEWSGSVSSVSQAGDPH